MALNNIPLYNFGNGTLMIIIFVLVCVILVVALLLFISSGKTSHQDTQKNNIEESQDTLPKE
ncbi:hypothetical protein [Myroides sp. LJL119]